MTMPTPANIRVKLTSAEERTRVEKLRAGKRRRMHPLVPWCVGTVAVVLIALVVLALSRGPRAQAPALSGDPVYVNKQEGFRFLRPDGWRMRARGEFPASLPADTERMLVGYQRTNSEKLATLDVTMLDVPGEQSLVDAMARPGIKGHEWHSTLRFEMLKISGLDAARASFEATLAGQKTIKETLAVRRGGRVYFFTTVAAASDNKARAEARKALETLSW
jgi:hypothetical protein